MRNFQDTPEPCKRSFISSFSICMTVPLITEAYLEPNRISMMKLLAVNYFCEKCPLQMFDWVLDMPLNYKYLAISF